MRASEMYLSVFHTTRAVFPVFQQQISHKRQLTREVCLLSYARPISLADISPLLMINAIRTFKCTVLCISQPNGRIIGGCGVL